MAVEIIPAHASPHLDEVRTLFIEYAQSLDFSLCFQAFDDELAQLPGEYAPPDGRLLLARVADQPVGCVALRRIDAGACEMKRLYLRPVARGQGVGRALAVAVIAEARQIGYAAMRLDTVPAMTAAIALYRSLGFREIPPYRHNPLAGAVFMELALEAHGSAD
jgi:putative acetyltransferase